MENRFNRLVSVVLIAAMLTPSAAYSAEKVPAPQDPTIAPLDQGQPAPWPGALLNAAAVGSIKFDYDHEKDKIEAAVQKAVSDVTTQKSGEIDSLKATFNSSLIQKDAIIEEKDGQISMLDKENKKLRDEVANAPSRTTWFSLGFAGGIVFTVLTAFAIGQVAK